MKCLIIAGLPRGLAGVITGFDPGDTIELTGVTATGSSYAVASPTRRR